MGLHDIKTLFLAVDQDALHRLSFQVFFGHVASGGVVYAPAGVYCVWSAIGGGAADIYGCRKSVLPMVSMSGRSVMALQCYLGLLQREQGTERNTALLDAIIKFCESHVAAD